MTLDPVHFDGITRLARRVSRTVDERDQQAFAETVWEEFLDPLRADGRTVLEPLDEQRLRAAPIEEIALRERTYPTSHGLDSGTINPTTFKNGLVVDLAQAAMSATPSDLELHRARTVVKTVHTTESGVEVDDGWTRWDEGYTTSRILRAPPVDRFEEAVVHELSLYLAESQHALAHADAVSDLFVLDGPIYPKGLLNWTDRSPELADLLYTEESPRSVIENYVRLVETFAERGVPLVGFVKNPTTKAITRTLRDRGREAPWVNDTALFTRLLERVERVERVDRHGERTAARERRTDELTFTNWFRSRGGADRFVSAGEDLFGIDRERDPADYEVTFFALYDPRDDLLYRVEAPHWVTRDADRREALALHVVSEVAAERGPPEAVSRADELARIDRASTRSIRERMEVAFDADRLVGYDDKRWPADPGGY